MSTTTLSDMATSADHRPAHDASESCGTDGRRELRIGTSGWNYAGWQADFYHGVRARDWLRFCAERFTALEVNATFYHLQSRATFERWHDETPDGFRFAIKANRFLTHNRKLAAPREPVLLERERASALAEKLAVVVWQLPPRLGKSMERLRAFVGALARWPEARHALELRHPSWFDEEVADCLHTHGMATCLSDAADWPMWDAVTTDLVYVRLHGHTRTYASAYAPVTLKRWAARARAWIGEGRDVHLYFDNTAEGAAPRDALRMIELTRGGCTRRSPARHEAH